MDKKRFYETFLNIVLPVGLIFTQAFFQFVQMIILQIESFGLQDSEYTPENKTIYYQKWIPLVIMGITFALICGLLIVIGFIRNKNNNKNKVILLLSITVISIVSLLAILIAEIVYLHNIGLLVFNGNLLSNGYFYFIFSPHFITLAIIAIMSIMRISDQVDDLKAFLV